jgi:hypothetical protein
MVVLMRNISFSATTEPFRQQRKHVTRRGNKKGPTWKNLRPGDHLMGCEKCQGLGRGGKVVRLSEIVILEINTEPVEEIIRRPNRHIPIQIENQYQDHVFLRETTLEGFPAMKPFEFVNMFCEMNNCEPETEITRILFDYAGRIV